jgi:1-deoxy-D-xylulose 5-phosphate reductoisomerase
MKSNILILGSTGSIGTQTLEVLSKHKDKFNVWGLVCHKNEKLLKAQAKKFKVKHICATSKNSKKIYEFIKNKQVDLIVNGISGSQGLKPTIAALKAGKTIALANKESIVLEGKKIMALANCDHQHTSKNLPLGSADSHKLGIKIPGQNVPKILPLDSEHHAILRLLQTKNLSKFDPKIIKKITITASGGPFFGYTKSQLKKITLKDALNHPNWEMGPKILIESATLLNKGYELIEAHHLFGIPLKNLDAIIDRKSYIHAIVEFENPQSKPQPQTQPQPNSTSKPSQKLNPKLTTELNSEFTHKFDPKFAPGTYSLALAYKPDMKTVIEDVVLLYRYNSTKKKFNNPKLKFLTSKALSNYNFNKIDHKTFPAIKETLKAFKKGQIKTFYHKSEIAIKKYLEGKTSFQNITKFN